MNELALELARRAGLKKEHGADREYIGDFEWRHFAQLIVDECVKNCESVAAIAETTNTGEMARKTKTTADSCAQMIKQRFGVEE